ncbi:MAG: hypothetical protein ACJA2W_001957, partial [Planctomycetota bacterium]
MAFPWKTPRLRVAATLLAAASTLGGAAAGSALDGAKPGAAGSDRGLVVLARKALPLPLVGVQVIDNAAMIVEDGKVVRVVSRTEVDLEAL